MRRSILAVAALAIVLTAGLVRPDCVAACDCAIPPSLEAAVAEPDTAVVVGTVGDRIGNAYPLVVERWFAGPDPSLTVVRLDAPDRRVGGDIVEFNTCGRSYTPGERLLLVGHVSGNDFATSICNIGADLGTPEGAALLADAQALFGPGHIASPAVFSPEVGSTGEALQRPTGTAPWTILIVVAVLGFAGLVVGLLVAARRRTPGA